MEQLIKAITKAFPINPRPQKSEILYSGAYEDDEELLQIEGFFEHRAWNQIGVEDVFKFRSALSFFSSAALIYFIPAYLINSILDEEAVDTVIEDVASTIARQELKLWTEEQRIVLCEWLIYFKDSIMPAELETALKKLEYELTNNS